MNRTSGVLMHISSLFGDYSCGSFGEEAKYFVDFLADCGFSWWQVLPFCLVDECNSPYKSYSAFAGNPYFIDLNKLNKKGLLTDDELWSAKQQTPYSCEYTRLYHTRYPLLMAASKKTSERDKIEKFILENPYLDKFCTFMALKEANNQKPWNEWENSVPDTDTLFMWKFIQYEFFTQWSEIKSYANSKGIKIIGDIPIYVSYDSADVWSNKDLFDLDEDFTPRHVAGVPPDYFSEDGQLWGNPLYKWDIMKKDGFLWWKDRLSHAFKMFDSVRIDHFRGLESYWSVEKNKKTAKEGKWEKGPGKDFIDMIHASFPDDMVIAEDLGEITEEVNELVKYSSFPGMKVFQFGFFGDYNNTHQPHNYPENCVAYTGTHDNNTLLGYVWELGENERKNMLSYCGYDNPDWNNGYDSILKTIFQSHAKTVILPIQDVLGYGSDTRLNIPGKPDGNWQFRITKEQLDGINREKYKKLNYIYGRKKPV